IVTTAGGLAMLVGMVLLITATGTGRIWRWSTAPSWAWTPVRSSSPRSSSSSSARSRSPRSCPSTSGCPARWPPPPRPVRPRPPQLARDPGPVILSSTILIPVGAISKSALMPFHFWLPGAMAAPTPVSAYLHAAAMVKAGIYLVLRLAPGYNNLPGWSEVLLTLGLLTMFIGGWQALKQTDLKLLLAFGTVSQL